jgi:hypothetical protein
MASKSVLPKNKVLFRNVSGDGDCEEKSGTPACHGGSGIDRTSALCSTYSGFGPGRPLGLSP